MPRAKKYRVRRTLTLTKEANQLLNEQAKSAHQELSYVVSCAITEWVKNARAAKWQEERDLD